MTTPRHDTRIGSEAATTARVPGDLVQRWTLLFQPTRALSVRQQQDAKALCPSGWQKQALCAQADPEAWFPRRSGAVRPEVFRICAACPVRSPCLATALRTREYGVWAGTTAQQRRDLHRMLRTGTPLAEVLDCALNPQPASAAAASGEAA